MYRGSQWKHTRDKRGNTLLHIAVQRGYLRIVQLLLLEGCDVNAVNRWMFTPLHEAAAKGDKTVVDLLIQKGAMINEQNNDGDPPLFLAIRQQSTDCVSRIIAVTNFNPMVKNKVGLTARQLVDQQIADLSKNTAIGQDMRNKLSRFSNIVVRSILEKEVAINSRTRELANTIIRNKTSFFFSYCWNREYSTCPMVDDLEAFLKKLGVTTYYRDVREEEGMGMTSGTHIETFMQNAKAADVVVIFLNDAYLRSRNCMYELMQVWDNDNRRFYDKVFVIFHPEFNSIFGGGGGASLPYSAHWEAVFRKVKDDMDDHSTRVLNLKELPFVGCIQANMVHIVNQFTSYMRKDYEQLRLKSFEDLLSFAVPHKQGVELVYCV